jgi:hypothetical protein
MAAGPAIEMWSKGVGSDESPDGIRRIITRQKAYTMTLDPADEDEVVYQAAGLPLVNSAFPGKPHVRCRKLSHSRIAPALGMVIADYQGESNEPDKNEVEVEWYGVVTDEAIDQDIYGQPIVTKNNEPIDGLTERIPDSMAVITRRYITFNPRVWRQYQRSRTSDVFLGEPAGTGRLMDWRARATWTNGVPSFWTLTASVQFREPYNTTADKAWFKRVRHQGLLVRDSPGGTIRPAWDDAKTIATRPVLLKENGTQETDAESAFWLEFETTFSLPYAALGLVD